MILYQSPLSTYSLKVRLALAVKGVAPELREPPGGSYRSPAYHALVPPGTVPALVDGDFVLSESDAIIEYLDERCAGPRLLPSDMQARARARMLSRLVDLRLEAGLRALFPQVKERRPLGPPDLEPAERALSLVLAMADPAGPWLCGAEPSLPDFGLAAALVWLEAFRAAGQAAVSDATVAPEPSRPAEPREPLRLAAWTAARDAERRFQPLLADYCRLADEWLDGFGFAGGRHGASDGSVR